MPLNLFSPIISKLTPCTAPVSAFWTSAHALWATWASITLASPETEHCTLGCGSGKGTWSALWPASALRVLHAECWHLEMSDSHWPPDHDKAGYRPARGWWNLGISFCCNLTWAQWLTSTFLVKKKKKTVWATEPINLLGPMNRVWTKMSGCWYNSIFLQFQH